VIKKSLSEKQKNEEGVALRFSAVSSLVFYLREFFNLHIIFRMNLILLYSFLKKYFYFYSYSYFYS